MKTHPVLLGAHLSTEGGLEQALVRAHELGCPTLQIFIKSNRQWHAKPLTNDVIEVFKETRKELNISPVISHATYLINIASSDADTRNKSKAALEDEITRCDELGIDYLVLHPGAHTGSGAQVGIERIHTTLKKILENKKFKVKIALETMAGQGTTLGSSLEELAEMAHAINDPRLGFCIDTCHIFAAGYPIATREGYDAFWKQTNKLLGLKKIFVIHLNDSQKIANTHVDRHEYIGKGKIGLDFFKWLMNDEKLADIPKIIEAPKDTPTADKRNLAL